jgi:hypothetical protein
VHVDFDELDNIARTLQDGAWCLDDAAGSPPSVDTSDPASGIISDQVAYLLLNLGNLCKDIDALGTGLGEAVREIAENDKNATEKFNLLAERILDLSPNSATPAPTISGVGE